MEHEPGVMTQVATLRGLKLRIHGRVLREAAPVRRVVTALGRLTGQDPHAWERPA